MSATASSDSRARNVKRYAAGVKLALFAIALVISAGCKDKPKEPARSAPPPPATTPTPRPSSAPSAEPTPAPMVPADAAEAAVDAAPTPSQQALAARAEFFSKVAVTAKKSASDCGQLATALEALAPEARALAARRAEVTGEEVAQDDAMVRTTLRTLSRMTGACPDAGRFDALLNTLGQQPE